MTARRLDRPDPPYLQIAGYYRQRIIDGELVDGDRLPSTAQIAQEWSVAVGTVIKAMARLQADGLIRTSSRGTFVAMGSGATLSPGDRLQAVSRVGRIYPPSEASELLDVGLADAPDRVLAATGADASAGWVRRARVTLHGSRPVTYSVSWLPPDLAEAVPDLLSRERILGGTVSRIAEVTGRTVVHGRDQIMARGAAADEAEALRIEPRAPVLVGTNLWVGSDGLIEFGEFVIPAGLLVTYEYDLGGE